MNVRGCLLIALVLVGAAPVSAQAPADTARRYVTIPFDGDLESALKGQLGRARDLEALRKLVDGLIRDGLKSGKLPKIDPQAFKADNEVVRQVLKELVNRPEVKKQLPPAQVKAIEKALKELPAPPPDVKNEPGGHEPPEPSPQAEAPQPDGLARWAMDFMERLEDSNLGNMLRDSPAWRQGLRDLQDLLGKPGMPDWNPPAWVKDARWKVDFELLGKPWQNLGDWSLPGWAHVTVPMPNIGGMAAPNLRMPGVPSVDLQGVGWLLLALTSAAGVLFLAWHVLRNWQPAPRVSVSGLGPWPVAPDRVSTPAELILAFDYLGMLVFGAPAQSWNHRHIARRLGLDRHKLQSAAQRLARQYELARYAPELATLPPETRAVVRRDLCACAEVDAP